jgi:hypothetical protein
MYYIMPKKSNKRNNKGKRTRTRTRKQKRIIMIGCSKKNKKSCKKTFFSTLGNKGCPNCGPNCHCGPNCKCKHPCPGSCYLNRRVKKHKGGSNYKPNSTFGSGCGSCGCPLSPMSWSKMNQFGGNPVAQGPVLIEPPLNKGDYIPIPGIGQNGGSCGACGQTQVMSGGNFFKPPGPMPGPKVGSAWEPNKLPGENGIGGDRNFLSPYNTNNNPQLKMTMNNAGYKTLNSMVGGKHRRKKNRSRSRKQKLSGGGFFPEDLVNLGRSISYNYQSAYNAIKGYEPPVNPLPYKDQMANTNKMILV